MELLLFWVFAAICIGGALNLLAQKHPINSALSLVVVMASLAVEYLLLGAEFVAAVQVIIYAGAIMVLFIFVIMLLNAGEEPHGGKTSLVAKLVGIPALGILAVMLVWSLGTQAGGSVAVAGAEPGPPQVIARLLFNDFLLPFEVTSVLVLIAIMGAVVLAAPLKPHHAEQILEHWKSGGQN